MTSYTNSLTAEQLIQIIANDYVELSHDKVVSQRDYHMKICGDWLEHQYQLEQLDPDKRKWEYDGLGNKIVKGTGNKLYPETKDDF